MGLFNKRKKIFEIEPKSCSVCGEKPIKELSWRKKLCENCDKLQDLSGRGYWGQVSENPTIGRKANALLLLLNKESVDKEKYIQIRNKILKEEETLNNKKENRRVLKAKKLLKVN